MGLHAALKLADVIRNTRDVLAIESLCAAQGLDLLGMRSTAALEEARRVIREHVPTLDEDRALSGEIATMSDLIAREMLIAAMRRVIADLH